MNKNRYTCLVTGASSGIGYAIAKFLLADNHRIIVTARRKERLNELVLNEENILSGDLTR